MFKKKSLATKIRELFKIGNRDEQFFDDLEDALIEGDIGAKLAMEISDHLKEKIKSEKLKSRDEFTSALKNLLEGYVMVKDLTPEKDALNVFLVLGVNGVGKTSTIAKLANYYMQKKNLPKILLSAGDTFRAAAIDQLKYFGKKMNLPVISQPPGSDPGAVIFDSITSAQAKGMDLVLADTAGRMHNRENLVKELEKIDKIVKGKINGGSYKKILIIDATTGQNALQQAEIFNEFINIDSIILTKYDSTAKGGIVVPICKKLGLPFSFMTVGETIDDITPFNKSGYLDTLVGQDEN
ncbi:MAG: signal recognition particle-docking protein FtsY [Spirochaetales bacterium]|nr:signal recognition particle-docking protein FtsY [Spirochaetales bacterium]